MLINLKKCNLQEDLTQDRSEWRKRFHLANPNTIETRLWWWYDDDDDDFFPTSKSKGLSLAWFSINFSNKSLFLFRLWPCNIYVKFKMKTKCTNYHDSEMIINHKSRFPHQITTGGNVCRKSNKKNIIIIAEMKLQNLTSEYVGFADGNFRTRRVPPCPVIVGAISSPLLQCK